MALAQQEKVLVAAYKEAVTSAQKAKGALAKAFKTLSSTVAQAEKMFPAKSYPNGIPASSDMSRLFAQDMARLERAEKTLTAAERTMSEHGASLERVQKELGLVRQAIQAPGRM